MSDKSITKGLMGDTEILVGKVANVKRNPLTSRDGVTVEFLDRIVFEEIADKLKENMEVSISLKVLGVGEKV